MILKHKTGPTTPPQFDRAGQFLLLSGALAFAGALLTVGVWITAGVFLSNAFPIRILAILAWVSVYVGLFCILMSVICLGFWRVESRNAAKRKL